MPLSSTTRITPAYAGKSPFDRIRQTGNKDHPRLCGEKQRTLTSGFVQMGSPPPMRGKDDLVSGVAAGTRITPAYAGKSINNLKRVIVAGDHPRLCGEKFLTDKFSRSYVGSPPPMRGKASLVEIKWFIAGITPAYAGKSASDFDEAIFCRDHPRLCGEKRWSDYTACKVPGSPPPMRGKVPSIRCSTPSMGITPAYAGKSVLSSKLPNAKKDHPRLCGEKYTP